MQSGVLLTYTLHAAVVFIPVLPKQLMLIFGQPNLPTSYGGRLETFGLRETSCALSNEVER